ncbi:MAG TPA: histidine kinase [Opitutaceae bacterium]|nr:histidine kinase [Opitutaceae bacterium]
MPAPLPTTAKPFPPDWRGYRFYWRTQIVGWLAVNLFLLVHAQLNAEPRASLPLRLVALGCLACCGIASTHLLRGWLRSAAAVIGPWPRLAGYGGVGVVGAGLLMAAGISALPLLVPGLAAEIWTDRPAMAFVARLFLSASLCAGWLLLYLGYESVRSYQSALTDRARYETALKDAELRALRGQLNPHFLFNALNVLRRLAATDPSRTRQAITQLAGLLRDTLNGGEQAAIKLSAELRQVDAYLQLEKLRFEERLELAWEVPEDAMGRPVPPFAVLTLVENAVKHGIASRIAGGRLVVGAELTPEATLLRVTNSGTLPADPRTGRVGMQNLRERLRLLYGERATLELRALPGELVVAELRVPAEWPAPGLTSPAAPSGSVSTP